ncbi:hypothetical protein Csa_014215 [Cucumis sativus]|uniref:Uncharacterized protein n=1 Tax=Cucumis sativus TaxID=3659 RepID=A0A0A0LS99_CUCSA|nr:hypothetical protein Csa_014215 [Cucumis sativus]
MGPNRTCKAQNPDPLTQRVSFQLPTVKAEGSPERHLLLRFKELAIHSEQQRILIHRIRYPPKISSR